MSGLWILFQLIKNIFIKRIISKEIIILNKENKMSKGVALGFVETRGNTGAVNAIDAMLKTVGLVE